MKSKETRPFVILSVYAFLMLAMMGVAVLRLSWQIRTLQDREPNEPTVTEKYVYVYADKEETEETTAAPQESWIVREHERRIGIFSSDGTLLDALEIDTKTLPMADRILLREGITVRSRSELYALIEDYSE